MTRTSRLHLLLGGVTTTAFALLMLFGGGCLASSAGDESVALMPINERGGAQLWGDNCARCHNSRSPSEFDDGQWDVIAHHMRVRANLTGYEHDTILRFLKSAN
jgi:hypothetical protein